MKTKPYIPFQNGTVRGPYRCGWGSKAQGGVQFLVQTATGWVPFIRASHEEGECCKAAETFAKQHRELDLTESMRTEPLTVKLSNGRTVLAKLYEGEPSAITYANRTQAERAVAKLGNGWTVGHWGRPFYAMKEPADANKERLEQLRAAPVTVGAAGLAIAPETQTQTKTGGSAQQNERPK